ncbi:SDR family oxidoreductase [Clostridium sp. YIM B02565]|uniref:SDR family oxidoreductase n=1 Tax=Clostridium paridis TaxID=2803863 RepID=A0A937FE16_9CLOT|nr:SDR family oxidoreductase [Clostridium paridis]
MTKKDRVAIVTGGSRGIGRAISERLAADGQTVVIAYASNAVEANKTVQSIVKNGGKAIAIKTDISDEVAVSKLFDIAEKNFGGVDVVVNSAGIMGLNTIANFDLNKLDQIIRTNIRGTFVIDQQAARRVRSGGAIINLSTSVKKLALPTYAAYSASKGAVDAISLVLAKELRGRDITVNAVAPGPTATELFFEGKDEETIDRMAKMNPIERLGKPEDIAEVVSFLAGPGRWINGQTIYVNGGMV